MTDVSIVIVTYNRKDLLEQCLHSLKGLKVKAERIVVDNASTDGTVKMIRKKFPKVKVIEKAANERFARANNAGISQAGGRHVFLLNNDTEVRPGVIESLCEFLDKNNNVGMVGPQLLNPDGSIQPSCHKFPNLWTHCCDMLALDRLFPKVEILSTTVMAYFDHRTMMEVDHVTAAAVMVRSKALQDIGFFDEALSIYYNDLDLSFRLKSAGWKTIFLPTVQVLHYGGQTANSLKMSWEFFEEQYKNIFYYYHKVHGGPVLLLYKLLLLIGFLPRAAYWWGRSFFNDGSGVVSQKRFAVWTLKLLLAPRSWRMSS